MNKNEFLKEVFSRIKHAIRPFNPMDTKPGSSYEAGVFVACRLEELKEGRDWSDLSGFVQQIADEYLAQHAGVK